MNRLRRDDSLEVVEHLTTVLRPRYATTVPEAEAAAYIDGRLRRAGMHVVVEAFEAPTSRGLAYPLLALAGFIAALVARWAPIPALLLALGALAVAAVDAFAGPLPPLLARRHESQNVVGNRASEKLKRWRVVVLAPLDTPPAGSLLGPATESHRIASIGRMAALALIALLAALFELDQQLLWWYGQLLPTTYLLASLIPSPAAPPRGTAAQTRGGASALAVLLAIAERLSGLRTVELWTVALGATTTGGSGLRDFMSRYPFIRDETLLIAIERIEDGQLSYATREGMLGQYAADPLLIRLAADADAADQIINAEPRPHTAAPSIVAPLHGQGFRTITILTQPALTRATPGADRTDETTRPIEQATRLVAGMVRQLDE